MNAENAAAEAEHHAAVAVGDDSLDIAQPERLQPLRKTILEQKALLSRPKGTRPAYPLTRFRHNP